MVKKWITTANIRLIVGAMGFIHEIFFANLDRPWLLVIAAGLMGYGIPKKLDQILNGPSIKE